MHQLQIAEIDYWSDKLFLLFIFYTLQAVFKTCIDFFLLEYKG